MSGFNSVTLFRAEFDKHPLAIELSISPEDEEVVQLALAEIYGQRNPPCGWGAFSVMIDDDVEPGTIRVKNFVGSQ